MEPESIAAFLGRIARSPLSVSAYLKRNKVPFSRSQYFQYKTRFERDGLEGLVDGRSRGNHRRLTEKAQGFISGWLEENAELSLREITQRLKSRGIQVSHTTVSRFVHAAGLAAPWPRPRAADIQTIESACGGFEIIVALAWHLGWARHTANVLVRERERFRKTEAYQNERVRRDYQGRNSEGRFTAAYNRRKDIRAQRFASVEDKREGKNYSRMNVFQSSLRVLERKCLGILCLPLITLNGQLRSANHPLGNALDHLCGFNYQHTTLDKLLRELKYLGVSQHLLRDQITFWRKHWAPLKSSGLPLLCFYVDGNTKALWSKKHVKENKVTMLGRVMGCLEQVFVHDAFGRPVYLETHAGKAPVGEHILGLFEKIEVALEGPGPSLRVRRVIVMDAASNGVATLRAFAQQDKYHYITALDDNQWNPRKVIKEGRPKRYHYGKATLFECRLELEDSKEKGYLVEVRAVRIEWDHGKRTVLITSLPQEAVGASRVVKAYFDRWPCEELQFRSMKHFACLNRVAGYGKKRIADEKVRERQRKLQGNIAALRKSLQEPLKSLADEEEKIAHAIEEERRIKSHGKIVDGKRRLKKTAHARMKELAREIAASQRQIKAIESESGKPLSRLRNSEKEWLRLQDKDYVYRIDVELDQLMGFFRIALVNIASWFLNQCLDRRPMSLSRLFQAILMMPAKIQLSDSLRRVVFERNPKDPDMMANLESALRRLNKLNISDPEDRKIEFALSAV